MQTRPHDVDAGIARMSDFVGTGSMRCGSSTRWRMLEQHERVYVPDLKFFRYTECGDHVDQFERLERT